MTEDEMDAYAVSLADAARISVGDPVEAAAVLIQAGLALLTSTLPPHLAIEAMELMISDAVKGIKALYVGAGQTRQ